MVNFKYICLRVSQLLKNDVLLRNTFYINEYIYNTYLYESYFYIYKCKGMIGLLRISFNSIIIFYI